MNQTWDINVSTKHECPSGNGFCETTLTVNENTHTVVCILPCDKCENSIYLTYMRIDDESGAKFNIHYEVNNKEDTLIDKGNY